LESGAFTTAKTLRPTEYTKIRFFADLLLTQR